MSRSRPNSRNTIPGQVFFTVDFRHPDDAMLSAMDRDLRDGLPRDRRRDAASRSRSSEFWYFPPTPFEPKLRRRGARAAPALGYPHRDIVSGAGHDAVYMARVAPTAMIFVPCEDGISHNEIEDAKPDDLAAGCNVLLHAILAHAHQG